MQWKRIVWDESIWEDYDFEDYDELQERLYKSLPPSLKEEAANAALTAGGADNHIPSILEESMLDNDNDDPGLSASLPLLPAASLHLDDLLDSVTNSLLFNEVATKNHLQELVDVLTPRNDFLFRKARSELRIPASRVAAARASAGHPLEDISSPAAFKDDSIVGMASPEVEQGREDVDSARLRRPSEPPKSEFNPDRLSPLSKRPPVDSSAQAAAVSTEGQQGMQFDPAAPAARSPAAIATPSPILVPKRRERVPRASGAIDMAHVRALVLQIPKKSASPGVGARYSPSSVPNGAKSSTPVDLSRPPKSFVEENAQTQALAASSFGRLLLLKPTPVVHKFTPRNLSELGLKNADRFFGSGTVGALMGSKSGPKPISMGR